MLISSEPYLNISVLICSPLIGTLILWAGWLWVSSLLLFLILPSCSLGQSMLASFRARWYIIDICALNILWLYYVDISTGDPLHSRAACTQPCNVNTHSRAHCSRGARLCEQCVHGCVNNGARLCASARLCRGSPVISLSYFPIEFAFWANYILAIWLFVFCSKMVKYP